MKTNIQIIREARQLLKETAWLISVIAPALSHRGHEITDTIKKEDM